MAPDQHRPGPVNPWRFGSSLSKDLHQLVSTSYRDSVGDEDVSEWHLTVLSIDYITILYSVQCIVYCKVYGI